MSDHKKPNKQGTNRPGPFRFKRFNISYGKSSMPVGTDALLLGSWAGISDCKKILDIGTGPGVIALMLAQRSGDHTIIDAIDNHKDSCLEAIENIKNSPWPQKINVFNCSLQDFYPSEIKYELIISNPPFFMEGTQPATLSRTNARHGKTLTYEELIHHSERLLKSEGRLAVIIPRQEHNNIESLCKSKGLYPVKTAFVSGKSGKPAKRVLAEYIKSDKGPACRQTTFSHYDKSGRWSDEYSALTKDFHHPSNLAGVSSAFPVLPEENPSTL